MVASEARIATGHLYGACGAAEEEDKRHKILEK
jgi:hypothetical protein